MSSANALGIRGSRLALGPLACGLGGKFGPCITPEMQMVTVGLLAKLKAKPGKQAELEALLKSAEPMAKDEPDIQPVSLLGSKLPTR